MKRLIAVGFIFFLSLSLGNALPVLAYQEGQQSQCQEENIDSPQRERHRRERGRRRLGVERMKREHPELYEKMAQMRELEQKSRQLAEVYKGVEDPAKKEVIKSSLKDLLNKLFYLRLEGQKARISHLEERLKELRENISKRKENKEEIVNRRLKKLTTGTMDYLHW